MPKVEITGLKGLIWDLDGTLIKSGRLMNVILAELAEERGIEMPSADEITKNFHGTLDDTLAVLFKTNSAAEQAAIVDNFLALQEKHYQEPAEHVYEDAIALAGRAATKNIQQLVLTNRSHAKRGSASPRYIIGNTVLGEYIQEIRCGDEVQVHKPEAAAVQDWVDKHQLKSDSLWVIGDQMLDGQLALNLGARAVLVKRGGPIPHMEKLGEGWQAKVNLVDDLSEVGIL